MEVLEEARESSLLILHTFNPSIMFLCIIPLPAYLAVSSMFDMIGFSNLWNAFERSARRVFTTFCGIIFAGTFCNFKLSPLLRLP